MAKKMLVSCLSDPFYMKATVSQTAITNLPKLPLAYSLPDSATIPHVEFRPTTTVFFLTGRTQNKASETTFSIFASKYKETQEGAGDGQWEVIGLNCTFVQGC